MSKELQKRDNTPASVSPSEMMQIAMQSEGGLDKLEKMMEMQERYEANEAKKAYVKAMAAFKADPPRINKDQKVDFKTSKGRTTYEHASLANVTSKINAALSEHGLSAGWKTEQGNGGISVTCTITHEKGHSESTTLISAPDQSGGKNSIQAIGSTVTYLQRYTILALTGLATHENENDGAPVETVTPEQISELNAAIDAKGVNRDALFNYLGIGELSELWSCNFDRALNAIAQAKGSK